VVEEASPLKTKNNVKSIDYTHISPPYFVSSLTQMYSRGSVGQEGLIAAARHVEVASRYKVGTMMCER
jgi:hypothetical protein